jgi:hypothetical protein
MKVNEIAHYKYSMEYWDGNLMKKIKGKGSNIIYHISSSKIYNVIHIDFKYKKEEIHAHVEYKKPNK